VHLLRPSAAYMKSFDWDSGLFVVFVSKFRRV
jgi:hypothetical protein